MYSCSFGGVFVYSPCFSSFHGYKRKIHVNNAPFFSFLLVVLVLALALGPVQPASDIVPHILIPLLVGNLGRRGRTPAGTTEKDNVLLWLRLGKGEFLKSETRNDTLIAPRFLKPFVWTYPLKVSRVEMIVQGVLELGQGQVDRRGNRPKGDLVRFPDVHQQDVLPHVHIQRWPSGVSIEKLTSEGCSVMGFNSSYATMGFFAHCEGLRSAASYLAWETTILSGWAVERALLAARGARG